MAERDDARLQGGAGATARQSLTASIVAMLEGPRTALTESEITDRLRAAGETADPDEVKRILSAQLSAFVRLGPDYRYSLVRRPQMQTTTANNRWEGTEAASKTRGGMVPVRDTSVSSAELRRITDMLEGWKKQLLDLGGRNKLLRFKSSRGTRLRLLQPKADDLYEELALSENKLSFAWPRLGSIAEAELSDAEDEIAVAERPGDIQVDYTEGSATDVRTLQKKLYRLYATARTTDNEQGITTLHVAIGFLRWQESDAAVDWVESPLLLIPVQLHRDRLGPYQLSGSGGDVVVNPALAQRLLQDFGYELPDFDPFEGKENQASATTFLDRVATEVRGRDWSVTNSSWLSHFSYEKLVMYEDLSAPGTAEAVATHPVLSAICGLGDLEHPEVSLEHLDRQFDLAEAFPVVNADSSQLEAIARARGGQNLVIQGPPGTGKSQTIVNLIAQAVRDGRSVLFVSEKRAALDVVFHRLRKVGLGDLCLELHSRAADKRSVVRELHTAMEESLSSLPAPQDALFEDRRVRREALDTYVKELHVRRGASKRSAYELHGILAHLGTEPMLPVALPVEPALEVDGSLEARYRAQLEAVVASGLWDTAPVHPWRGVVADGPSFTMRQELVPLLEELASASKVLRAERDSYVELTLDPGPLTLSDVPGWLSRLEALSQMPPGVRGSWLTLPGQALTSALTLVEAATSRCEFIRSHRAELKALQAEALADQRELVTELLPMYEDAYRSRLRRLTRGYRRARRRIRDVINGKPSYQGALDLLRTASALHEAEAFISTRQADLSLLTGTAWPPGEAAETAVTSALTWVGRYRWMAGAQQIDPVVAARLETLNAEQVLRFQPIRLAVEPAMKFGESASDATSRWFPDGLEGRSFNVVPLDELALRIESWLSNLDTLDEWNEFETAMSSCTASSLDGFLSASRAADLGADELVPAFARLVAWKQLAEAYRDAPAVGKFGIRRHEQILSEFQALDEQLMAEAQTATRHSANRRQDVVRKACAARFTHAGQLDPVTRSGRDEVKLIYKEHEKRTRHLPLRKLLPQIPRMLTAVKPCFLMSPLSVANYLPRENFSFDLVIFDEASQVLPADALGSILRARQIVVIGDSKQLPPSTFFQKSIDDGDDGRDDDWDEDGDALQLAHFESILDVSASVLPSASLRWHYRSKDERLIAFSNRMFYAANPLMTFPNPDDDGKAGISFEYVPDGVFGRGTTRTNPAEARRVVDLIVQHFDRHGWERSLGVITLSLPQRDAVDLELHRRLQERPDLLSLVETETGAEPFFVKNLENVQGDERDSIILSLGYGPAEPGGIPSLAFGPITAKGGERRLNVAVTRAKYTMTLISSMRPDHLDRTVNSRNEGPRMLASYVRYASRGGRFEEDLATTEPAATPGSEFEEAVAAALTARGFVVQPQVGVSEFRIDLGIVHPEIPTRFILGVECDGVAYHSSRTARDRDRLRQEILESLGWKIYRIWSTDWLQHPAKTLDSLIERINELVSSSEVGVLAIQQRAAATDAHAARTEDDGASQVAETPAAAGIQVLPSTEFIEDQRASMVIEIARLTAQLDELRTQHGVFAQQSDRGFALQQVERSLLQQKRSNEEAIKRIKAGSYGICLNCRRAIELDRLEARPSAEKCRICSQSVKR